MPMPERYLFTAAMDVQPDKEGVFHEVYDEEHIPALLEVPGVISVARFKTEELTMIIGGQRRTIVVENQPAFAALYELASPKVLVSKEWAQAVDRGRWPTGVRPFTSNRRHTLQRRLP
jgi:hypothetical protein